MHRRFEAQAGRTPDAIALVFEGTSLTYRELNTRANQLAHYLQSRGVGPGTLAGLYLERSVEMVVGLLGVLKAGAGYVPLDPEYPRARLAYVLEDTRAGWLLTQERLLQALPVFAGGLVCLDRDRPLLDDQASVNPDPAIHPDHPAYVVYTSGSTGRPKGVVGTHRGVANFLDYLVGTYDLSGADVVLQLPSLAFDASIRDLVGPLTVGARVVVVRHRDAKDPTALLGSIATRRVTCLLSVVPTMLNALAEASREVAVGCDALRLILVSGEPLRLSVCRKAQRAFGEHVAIVNQYGATECTMVQTYHPVREHRTPRGIALCGRPIPNHQVYVLDADLNPVPAGVPGEVYIAGAGLTLGYLNRPELTAERFIPNPFGRERGARLYRTGDLARWRRDGNLQFLGRIDHQVKIGGVRIELGEIEAVLSRHPQVRDCAVVAHDSRHEHRLIAKEAWRAAPEGAGPPRLVAYVVGRTALASADLRRFLEGELPAYMVPGQFVQIEALPLTTNGKVDVSALPAPASLRPELDEAFLAPRSPTESRIAEIWREVLGLDRVGVHDGFFELGGDSLRAIQVLNRVRQATGRQLSFQDLFAARTVAGLARLIGESHAGPASALPAKAARQHRAYPLSLAQQGIWFLWEMQPDNPYYTSQGLVHLVGTLNLPAFQRAWQTLLERHEILRVRFGVGAGRPIQWFEEPPRAAMPITDLSHLPEAERRRALRQAAREGVGQPFDLEAGGLLRWRLFKLAEREHALLLTTHEIATDLWSVRVLMRDLGVLYDGILKGAAAPLAPLDVNFSDYVLWEQAHLTRQSLKIQEDYWRRTLAGELPVLDLPLDGPRPASPSYRGGARSTVLDADLARALRALGRREGATLFMTLLSAFSVLLHRYTGQEDVIIGAPLAHRGSRHAEQLAGFFLNMLPLRVDLSDDPTVTELLRRVRVAVTGAMSHADYPFMWMLEWVRAARDTRFSPVFQVMFNMLSFPDGALTHDDLEIAYEGLETGYTKYDLSLYAQEHGERVSLQVAYLADLFAETTIDRLLRNFVVLLRGFVATPQAAVSTLEILDEAERRILLGEGIPTMPEVARDQCVHQLFERQVEHTPEAAALLFKGERLTYAELNSRANRLAHRLRRLGVGPEVMVGVCVERSFETLVTLLGVMKAGGAYVALDPRHPPQRLHEVLDDTRPPVLLVQRHLDRFEHYTGRRVYIGEAWGDGGPDETTNPLPVSVAGNLHHVVYTSASTGSPKGTLVTIDSVLNRLHWMWEAYPFRPGDVAVLQKSYALVAATWECFGALLKGVPTVILSEQEVLDPAEVWDALVRHRVSHLLASPAFLQGVLDQAELHPGEWASLRLATTSAEPITVAMVGRWRRVFPRVPLLNLYGSTECSSNVTEYDTSRMPPGMPRVPVGTPLPHTRVYVVDRWLKPVPIGVTGEMCVAGPCLARGYLNLPELTATQFVPNPYSRQPGARLFRTGDLARYRADGNLELVGRKDHQVKIRGYRVELGDVEAALARHEAVRSCAVRLWDDGDGPTRLVAYVAPRSPLSISDLRASLRERLPEYMVPAEFIALPALPLTPNGKVDRRALPAPERVRPQLDTAYLPPRTPMEEALARVWCEVLGVARVSIHDNFFDLGGHSLLAAQLMFRVRRLARQTLPLAALFQAPTVASLALLVAGIQEPPAPRLVPLSNTGTHPPLFCLHPLGGDVTGYRALADLLTPTRPVYAIQSRGLTDASREHTSIDAMAADYADRIRGRQPEGPYYLLGWSMGGVIAMAVAAALERQGQQVAFVGLLDTSLPACRPSPADGGYLWRRALNLGGPLGRALDALAPAAQQTLCGDLQKVCDALLPATPIERIDGIRRWLRGQPWLHAETRGDVEQQLVLMNTHDAMLMSHQPGRMRAPLHIWWAQESLARDRHAHIVWSEYTTGAVRVETTGGNHFTLVQLPHVRALAARVARCLQHSPTGSGEPATR
jgi:amino acid adenylation domain-containing protein